ncbi:MAG: TSUP family transporter [Treponema sp.]|jgi:uncharacterized membrane protein YfcA|nr:TSUP family transporter [Treponema sp.]
MDLSITAFLIICPMTFLAGFVDSIAGGGGLISFPAYLLAGIPVHFALGTNKLSSSMGSVTASIRYYRNRFVDLFLCLPSIAASLTGSALGSSLTLLVDEKWLRRLLLVILPVTAFYAFKNKHLDLKPDGLSRRRALALSVSISFFIGAYDGFFGPGTGTFLILLYTALVKLDPRTASGNAKFVNMASNLGALAVFLLNRRVIAPLGLCAGLFSVLGSYLGSGLAIRIGARVIRYFILAVLVLLFGRVIWETLSQAV